MCTFEEGLCKEWLDADKSTDKNKKKYRIFADTLNYGGHLRDRVQRAIDSWLNISSMIIVEIVFSLYFDENNEF